MVRAKTQKISGRKRKIEGDEQKDCRRLQQIAESILAFLEG
jgi:hypothetical protein